MRSLPKLFKFISVGLLFLTVSCQDEEVIDDRKQKETEDTQILSRIKDLGFSEDVVEDEGNYYVVEGDIVFYKDSLHNYGKNKKSVKNAQYSSGQLVSRDRQPNISVYLDPSLSQWKNSVWNAITAYNNIANSGIKFGLSPATNSDIRIVSSFVPFVADAVFPLNGRAGFAIRVNPFFHGANTDAKRQLIIAHELGHCIGLRHSNWHNGEPKNTTDPTTGAPITADLIGGTPQTDSYSVMNCCVAGNPWSGFSHYDKVALSTLYPSTFKEGVWQKLPGKATDISVSGGDYGEVYALGSVLENGGYGIYKWTGSNWSKFGGAGISIAVDANGGPWVVDNNQDVYRYYQYFDPDKYPGIAAIDIGIGPNNEVFAIGKLHNFNYAIYRLNGKEWKLIGGPYSPKAIAVDADGVPWVVTSTGGVFSYGSGSTMKSYPGLPAIDISIGANGEVFALGGNTESGGYGIYKLNGMEWVKISGSAVSIAVGPLGTPWVVNNKGNIYRNI